MAAELFFQEDGQDKTSAMLKISVEIAAAQDYAFLLKDRSEEITSTDLDLSCTTPYRSYNTAQAIYTLHTNAGLYLEISLDEDEDLGIIQLQDLPDQKLKDYFTAITLGYRQAALNILLEIGNHYKKAEGILPEFGPSRNTPHKIVEDILVGETIPVIKTSAFIKSKFENDMQEVRLTTNEAWSEMFNARDHQSLAIRYLQGKISQKQLMETISGMKKPTFDF